MKRYLICFVSTACDNHLNTTKYFFTSQNRRAFQKYLDFGTTELVLIVTKEFHSLCDISLKL